MNIHKEVLYDVEWQSLRVSLLGSFTTINGVESNIVKLKNYLRSTNKVKLWRVLNLLNAVRMGYHGQRLVGTLQDAKIIYFRNNVQQLYRNNLELFPSNWNWKKVQKDLQELYLDNQVIFIKILRNLKLRQKNALKRKTMQHRPELKTFLDKMEKIHIYE